MSDNEIDKVLGQIKNKYSGNIEQKYLNQMYEIGILVTNKKFDKEKLNKKLSKMIDERSYDAIEIVRQAKRKDLLNAFKQGVKDGSTQEYRQAYDSTNTYQYTPEKLIKRGIIDGILDKFTKNQDDKFTKNQDDKKQKDL